MNSFRFVFKRMVHSGFFKKKPHEITDEKLNEEQNEKKFPNYRMIFSTFTLRQPTKTTITKKNLNHFTFNGTGRDFNSICSTSMILSN